MSKKKDRERFTKTGTRYFRGEVVTENEFTKKTQEEKDEHSKRKIVDGHTETKS